jgi:hypothetical protein
MDSEDPSARPLDFGVQPGGNAGGGRQTCRTAAATSGSVCWHVGAALEELGFAKHGDANHCCRSVLNVGARLQALHSPSQSRCDRAASCKRVLSTTPRPTPIIRSNRNVLLSAVGWWVGLWATTSPPPPKPSTHHCGLIKVFRADF